jgi:deoxyhypusine synthase
MLRFYYVKKYRPISLKSVKTYSIAKRKSKVSLSSFAVPYVKGDKLKTFLDKLPDILAVNDFRALVKAVVRARQNKRPVILGMGAHPIKVGLSPVIIDLMRRNIITAIATNGACIIHDFELSFTGHTSEDVEKELCKGSFGMAQQTGRYLNKAIKEGIKKGYGIGTSIGELIYKSKFRFKKKSIFASAFEIGIPSTVHVAVGTDIIHMHPDADGSAIGEGSFRDFKLFVSVVSDLEGGVYINLGSAVIMPEVFLKALTISRNLGNKVENITTVNMDFIQHYRPTENVLRRPTIVKGSAYALTGHHEIMFPLLAAAIIEEMG